MNIYDFFNSPDVAEYCKSIGHKFNAVESAVMVSQSKRRTLAEKHAAYRTIIEEYPDMEIPQGHTHTGHKSFRKALKKYISIEEKLLEEFISPEEGAVYRVSFRNDSGDTHDDRCLFTTYKKALKHARDKVKDEDERKIEYLQHNFSCIVDMTVIKTFLDKDDCWHNSCTAYVSRAGEIKSIQWKHTSIVTHKTYADLYKLLDLYIDVPVPFKNGDLVEFASGTSWQFREAVYVLEGLCNEDENYSENLFRWSLDSMHAHGHFLYSDGTITQYVILFYPDLQYCRHELEGEKRIMQYLSQFYKGEIDIDSLLKMQEYVFADIEADRLNEDYDINYCFHENLDESLPWDDGGDTNIEKYKELFKEDKICFCHLMMIHRYLFLDERRRTLKKEDE